LPFDQLAISPQCGFASDVAGNLLGADERRKLERVVDTARLTPLDRVAGLRGR
jgi:5-methyltetrahydropteroyltriglutamate--homocysteine methyltransferase